MKLVIDTNVVVSALLNPDGTPAAVLNFVLSGNACCVYEERILHEYRDVLLRPKFPFPRKDIDSLHEYLQMTGFRVAPKPCDVFFPDEDDRVFYEVAKAASAEFLITGNRAHFPHEDWILTPGKFVTRHIRLQP